MKPIHRLSFALALLAAAVSARADEVQVAVAANFTAPMKEIAAAFENKTGHKVQTAYGATGKFYAQIKNGAPFEALVSADDATPTKLVAEGAAVKGTQFTYAIGTLVLWSAKPDLWTTRGRCWRKGTSRRLPSPTPRRLPTAPRRCRC